jgi:hypothetical protein
MSRKRVLLGTLTALLALTGSAQAAAPPGFGDAPVVNSVQWSQTTTAITLTARVTYNEKTGGTWLTYCRPVECPDGGETTKQEETLATDQEAVQWRTVTHRITGLRPSTVYRVTVHVESDDYFDDEATERTFEIRTADPTIPVAPVGSSSRTDPATGIQPEAATLNGVAVPGTTGGTNVPSTAYFRWGTTTAPMSNRTQPQALPADAAPYPMSAGLSGLIPGQDYRYQLIVERNGVLTAGQTQYFSTPAVPACTDPSTHYMTVNPAGGRITAFGCFKAAGDHWVANGPVRLNGVLLEPAGDGHARNPYRLVACDTQACRSLQSYLDAGNRFYIDRANGALGGTGDWDMSADHLRGMNLGGLVRATDVQWGVNATSPLMSVGADESVELLDFPLAGRLTWTPNRDGSSNLGLLVGLPEAFGGVTGESAVKINPGGDMSLDRLRIEVGEVPVHGFELGHLHFLYDRSADLWQGGGEVALPTTSKVRVGASVSVQHGRFRDFDGRVDGLNQYIAYGVYLQRLGVHFGVPVGPGSDLHLGGSIGFSAGPQILGVGALAVDGGYDLHPVGSTHRVQLEDGGTMAVQYPGYVELSGAFSAFNIPLSGVTARWYFSDTPWFQVSGFMERTLRAGGTTVFSAKGTVGGSLYGTSFELNGNAHVTVLDTNLVDANVIAGTSGIGACGSYTIPVSGEHAAIGAYLRWGQNRFTSVSWCEMGRLRRTIRGTASAASAQQRLALPAGDQALVRFTGDTAAPLVRLHGPGGRTIDAPANGESSATHDGMLVMRDDSNKVTDVLVTKPSAGWTYELLPGSARVQDLRTAARAPKLGIRAHVVRTGKRAKLSWRLSHVAGRTVTLMESGPGAPPRVLAKSTAKDGSVSFKPFITPERDRTIVAIVEKDGMPVSRTVVARYTAPAAGRVKAVGGLRAVIHGSRVKVAWKAQRAASHYRVLVTDRVGRRTLQTTKQHRIALKAATTRKVTVRAIGADGRVGPAKSVKPRQ